MAPLAQRAWQDDPSEEEARSYMERIDECIFHGDIRGARALVAEAIEKGFQHERLAKLQEILAPARVRGTRPADEPDRTRELRWVESHGDSYRGEWVALLGDELLAHSSNLKEVAARLDENPPPVRPLLYWIPQA